MSDCMSYHIVRSLTNSLLNILFRCLNLLEMIILIHYMQLISQMMIRSNGLQNTSE